MASYIPSVALAADMYEDFESYEVGDIKAGFDTFGGRIESDGVNKYAAITGNQITAARYIDATDGVVTISADLCGKDNAYARALTVWDSARKSRSLLIWMTDGKFYLSYDNAAKRLELGDAIDGQWYSLSVTLNFDTQRIEQVFLNGTACLAEPMTMLNKDVVITDAGYLEIKTEKADGTLLIDNISVEKILYPGINTALNEAASLLTREEGTEPGTYPSSAFTMLRDMLDSLRKETERENLTEEEQQNIAERISLAEEAFESTKILGSSAPMYLNDFEKYSAGASITTADGFLAAKNAVVTAGITGNAVKLTDSSRLLYQYSKELEGKYYITLSFMQDTKGKIDLLLDASDSAGKGHGPMVFSDGTNILARDENAKKTKTVIENYSANQWYDLKVFLDTDTDMYTVYARKSGDSEFEEKCTCIFPAISDGSAEYVMDKLRRVCNVQIYNAGSSVYVDNMGLYLYSEPVENGINSVSIDCPELVPYGESISVGASVYDRYHELMVDEAVTWSVVSGDATVDEYGNVELNNDYSGVLRLKAEASNGVYNCADIICLPEAVFAEGKAEIADDGLIITGNYGILRYTDADINVNVVAEYGDIPCEYSYDAYGNITVSVQLGDEIPSQEIRVVLTDSVYGMEEEFTYMHYGHDAVEVFVKKFNESTNPVEVIDEFLTRVDLGLNFAYDKDKEEYVSYIKSKPAPENSDEMISYIADANLVLGVKYATRDNIEDVLKAGDALLKEVDADKASLDLSDGESEKLCLELMGYDADDLSDLGDKILDIADSIQSSSSSSKPGKSPSYSGGGGGGGGRGSSSAVSISGAGFDVAVPDKEIVVPETETTDFEDIKEAVWAKEPIEKLAKLNVMNGYGGKVRPNDSITRAEFAKMVVELFDIQIGGENAFSDVSSDSWYAPYVSAMASAGLINGYPDGRFCPENTITRQDAAVILDRCVAKLSIPVYTKNEKISFADSALFEAYASEAIANLQSWGVISGKGEGIFEPAAPITRAETAVMLTNLYSFTESK